MSRLKNRTRWIEAGFELFAHEGHEGIQVERLARILELNKSGFYHYFGTIENYLKALMRHISKQADMIIAETKASKSFDPDFLNVLIRNKLTIMATMQLVRNRNVPVFKESFREVTQKIDNALLPLWSVHIGVTKNPPLALRYFEMIRDMFFARITFDALHYDFLHAMATEAKSIIQELTKDIEIIKKQE